MDIREVSQEEKQRYIDKVKLFFSDIRFTLNTLENDIESKELAVQASAVWISGNLCEWFTDFMNQIKKIDQTQKSLNDVKSQLEEAVNDSIDAHAVH